ncbi:MAG: DUF499 domain-containing protein [bacterium]|nr:DUF499 domain-containing protein [bacterium]
MKAFHTIAIPHKDILEGRLTMDVFAADLWEVAQKRGPDEYKDAQSFFQKTYMTQGLDNLLNVVERRLSKKGGDPVIQIQTPFGGGKTHALIAMYHKAAEWGANKVVIVGEKLKTADKAEGFETLWGVMEKQLTGSNKEFASPIPPGGEQIRNLLEKNYPVLILMDELIPYFNVSDTVNVGNRSLATLNLTYLQTLTNVVSEMPGVSLVLTTTPSNPYDKTERGEEIVMQLQNITARREIIKTPVAEGEITKIIRRRLFAGINVDSVKEVVTKFMEYGEKEGILPAELLTSEYRDRFLDSYPFMPEVVDVLYHRWGSFITFQRTRGVLRLLSLVIHSLKEKACPYISLADFNLNNQEIRQELIRHIGSQYNGIVAADVTDVEAGSKKVDVSLGSAYQGLGLGSRAATTIFLYSFSGGQKRGVNLGAIKRSATTCENPASVIAEAADQLKSKLFYLQCIGEKYFFSNQPNLNHLLLNHMENVSEREIIDIERSLLKNSLKGGRLKIIIWEENNANIEDSEDLKVVILRREDKELIDNILKSKGQTKRARPNTLFFLYPLESERVSFTNNTKRKIAYENIAKDKNLNLSEDQKRDVNKEIKKAEGDLRESIRRLYRMITFSGKKGLKDIDLGIPTYGENQGLDQKVYEKLRSEGEILERIEPLFLKEKYLSIRKYVSTEQLYQSTFKTPGETRLINKSVLEQGIAKGVCIGVFGLGEIEGDNPICRYFKEEPSISFSESEVIISEAVCQEQKEAKKEDEKGSGKVDTEPSKSEQITKKSEIKEERPEYFPKKTKDRVGLRFKLPKGKASNIMGLVNLLQREFETIKMEITASDGSISEQDYEDKVKEFFRQIGVEVEEE